MSQRKRGLQLQYRNLMMWNSSVEIDIACLIKLQVQLEVIYPAQLTKHPN